MCTVWYVLTLLKMSMSVFWAVTACELVGNCRYQSFGANFASIFKTISDIFLLNVVMYLQVHTALRPRKSAFIMPTSLGLICFNTRCFGSCACFLH